MKNNELSEFAIIVLCLYLGAKFAEEASDIAFFASPKLLERDSSVLGLVTNSET